MTEIHKFNGDIKSMVSDNESVGNWENLKDELWSSSTNNDEQVESDKYSINKRN